ncbi:hypothetical protein, partial [Staphylococcus aureus]
LLDADQMRALLRQRQQTQVEANSAKAPAPQPTAAVVSDRAATADQLGALRKELNGLVAMNVHRTGKPHGIIHAELRRVCGGPP